jgi:hypothetical protein
MDTWLRKQNRLAKDGLDERRLFDHALEHSPGVEPYALIFKRNFGDMRGWGSLTLKFVRNLRPENPRVHRKYNGPDFDFGFSQYAILNST